MADSQAIILHPRTQDLTGMRFGSLIVAAYAGRRGHNTMWQCKCDCSASALVATSNLKAGKSKCCGSCWSQSRSTEYDIWLKAQLERSIAISEDNCWEWQKTLNSRGYGTVSMHGRSVGAHVLSYELWNGPVGNMCVCHSCDNRKCINPAHLFLGTRRDNNNDKIRKHRQAKGERIGTSKLTETDVYMIRTLYRSGHLQRELALRFGVVQQEISNIVRGQWWKDSFITDKERTT